MRSLNIFRDRLRLWPLLIVLCFLFRSEAHAIDPSRAISQYVRDHWGAERGLPRGPIYAITQTPDGYIWIGSSAGLLRFDGVDFTLVKDESGVFTVMGVLGLQPDNEGSLWVRLEGPYLLRYRNGGFEDPIGKLKLSYSNVTTMNRTYQGGLLVSGSAHVGITFRDDKFEVLARGEAMPRSPLLSVAETGDGAIWMGTRDAGLFRAFEGKTTPILKGLPDTKLNCLLAVGKQDLWVGTDRGIARWNGAELTTGGIPAALNQFQTLAMAKDRDGNIWVGTDSRGLLRLNSLGLSATDIAGKGAVEAVTAVFEDREGSVWVGSASGLERFRDSEFVTYTAAEGLPSDRNGPVYVDDQNRTWFAPVDGGLYWLNNAQHGQVTEAGLGKDVVYSITGSHDQIWVGRQRGGLTRLRPQGTSFTAFTYGEAQGLAQNSVYSVYQAKDGAVWAGTLSGGVSKLSGGKFTTYTSADGLASNTVASILGSQDGTIWFATPNGLSALSKEQWHTYSVGEGLPSESVNTLFQDSAGLLWAGTAKGVAFRGDGRFTTPKVAPASLHEQVLGIAEDKAGALWIETANHVLRVSRAALLSGKVTEGDVRQYGVAEGLHSTEGVKRHRSLVADSAGRIWFSLDRGLSVVDPGRLAGDFVPPIVHIQSINADGANIDMRGPVSIPARRQRLTFKFAGLGTSVPGRLRFRYRLDGFDQDWNEPVTSREAGFTNLSPGPYRFRVMASKQDGVWNGTEAFIPFEITPLLWQRWWFQLACLLAGALAILAFYRFRLHQMTRQVEVRFEERLAERTRIAQELHDTLLQGFLSASMQLHVASEQLPPDSPAKPRLNRVIELVGQVIEEGRNAVRGLRSTHSSSLDLEQAFSRIQQEIGMQGDIGFRVVVEGAPQPLRPVLRDEVYRIGREALVNAFRHSHAKNIEIEVDYGVKQLRILVRDNGRGIDAEVLKSGRAGHWGLQGMRERAERIGAKLHVWSSAVGGTEVELSVPGHLAFQLPTSNGRHGWLARWYPQSKPTVSAHAHKRGEK